jgi:hypothetical protein
MTAAINFHHLVGWFDAANFAHRIGQSFNVINTGL